MRKHFLSGLWTMVLISLVWLAGCGQPTPPPPGAPTPAVTGTPASPAQPVPTAAAVPAPLIESEVLGGILEISKGAGKFTPEQTAKLNELLNQVPKSYKVLHSVENTAPRIFSKEQLAEIKKLREQKTLDQGIKLTVKDSLVDTALAAVEQRAKAADTVNVTPSGSKESFAWHDMMWGVLKFEKTQFAVTPKQARELLPQFGKIKESLDFERELQNSVLKILNPEQVKIITDNRQKFTQSFDRSGGRDLVIVEIQKQLNGK